MKSKPTSAVLRSTFPKYGDGSKGKLSGVGGAGRTENGERRTEEGISMQDTGWALAEAPLPAMALYLFLPFSVLRSPSSRRPQCPNAAPSNIPPYVRKAAFSRGLPASAGFTLLEVVVATAVLAIGVAIAMQVFSGGLSNLHHIDMSHRAMSHAENIMNELLSDQDIRGPYQSSGDLDEDFLYQARVDYWNDPNPSALAGPALPTAGPPQVYLLGIRVRIDFKDNQRYYQTFCLKAVAEDQGEQDTGERLRRLLGRQR